MAVAAHTIAVAEWAWQRQSVWSQTADKLKAGPNWSVHRGHQAEGAPAARGEESTAAAD